jgi:dipeptidyl aminopeptidase/acylaminoacyl peptidase
MKRSFFFVLLIVGLCASATLVSAAGMTPRQVSEIQSVSSAVISPDGTRIAAVRSVPRTLFEDDNGSAWSELLIVVPSSGEVIPFIAGKTNVGAVQWLPDSSAVSFVAKRDDDEHRSLYVIPIDGGEARRVLELESDITTYSWSPDGTQVAAVASAPECKKREELEKKGFNQKIYEEDWRPLEVFIATISGDNEPRKLELDGSVFQVQWGPTGKNLAVALDPTPLVDHRYMFQKVHVVSVESGKIVSSIGREGKLGRITWSPDGKNLAMISGVDLNDPSAGSLLLAPVTGGPAKNISEGFEGSVDSCSWTDATSMICLCGVGVESFLYQVDINKPELQRIAWDKPGAVFNSIDMARDGTSFALVGSSPTHPGELFIASGTDTGPRRLTDSNPWLADVELGRQDVVRHAARDGLELEGMLVYPLDYVEGQRYPLVMAVHGGPEAHRSNGWLTGYSNPAQVLAARGFAVFVPNYRGSTGRGVEFSKMGQKDAAGKEFDDLVDAVDHLIEIGLVDPKKVGVTGGSYGGYATAWLSTKYSERFAAGVMFVGISDITSKAGTTDIPEEEFLVHALQRPQDDFQFYLERSPIYHAREGRTPLLILGGEDDPRVDPSQSKEMYRALKVEGKVSVRLVIYPGEGHGNRKAAARYDYCLRALRWMEHYLTGPGGEMPDWHVDYQTPRDGWPEEVGQAELHK